MSNNTEKLIADEKETKKYLDDEKRIIIESYKKIVVSFSKLLRYLEDDKFEPKTFNSLFNTIIYSLKDLEILKKVERRAEKLSHEFNDIQHHFLSDIKKEFKPFELESLHTHLKNIKKEIIKKLKKDVHHSIKNLNEAEELINETLK